MLNREDNYGRLHGTEPERARSDRDWLGDQDWRSDYSSGAAGRGSDDFREAGYGVDWRIGDQERGGFRRGLMERYGRQRWRGTGGSWYGGYEQLGPHAGKGPRGYHRAEDRIREDICERLTDHPAINATEITVDIHDGEVTLGGVVEDRRQKRLAEDVAESVPGVRDVHNRLRLQRLSPREAAGGERPAAEHRAIGVPTR